MSPRDILNRVRQSRIVDANRSHLATFATALLDSNDRIALSGDEIVEKLETLRKRPTGKVEDGSVNFVTDFSGTTTGDNAAALSAFNVYARAESRAGRSVRLIVPAGNYDFNHGNCFGYLGGIKKLQIVGYGARFRNTYSGSANFAVDVPWGWGANGSALFSAGKEIQTVVVGATTITLVNPSDASTLAIGDRILIASLDIQSYGNTFGFPPNMDYMEYAKVTSINAGVLGVSPAIRYPHRSDFPDNTVWGKARIWKMDVASWPWDIDHAYEGLEIAEARNPYFTIIGRRIRFINCVIPGISPSMANRVEIKGCEITSLGEPDKMVDTVSIEDTIIHTSLVFQSSSINYCLLSNCDLRSSLQVGVVKYLHAQNCTIKQLQDSGAIYGVNRKTTLTNCRILECPFGVDVYPDLSLTTDGGPNVSFANGRFTVLKGAVNADAWNAIPGTKISLVGPAGCTFPGDAGVGIITKHSMNATHRFIDTTLPYTQLPVWATGSVRHQRAGEFRCINCDGHPIIRMASEADRLGFSPWEYLHYVFGGVSATSGTIAVTGTLRRAKINVIQSSPEANTRLSFTVFNVRKASDITDPLTYTITIDATVKGLRDFTHTALTGKAPNDSMTLGGVAQTFLPPDRWLGGAMSWSYIFLTPANHSSYDMPVIDVQFEVDAGMFRKDIPASVDLVGHVVCGITGGVV